MATSTPKQSFPEFMKPTFTPSLLYARLTSLVACQKGWLMWNASPWLGPLFKTAHREAILDCLRLETALSLTQKDLQQTAFLHLGTVAGCQQNIFVMFPHLHQGVESLVKNEQIMQIWTNDVMNAALNDILPSGRRDFRFVMGSYELMKLNSQAARVEANRVNCHEIDAGLMRSIDRRLIQRGLTKEEKEYSYGKRLD
jgi:hypothetical protein